MKGLKRMMMLVCIGLTAMSASAQKQLRPIYFDNPAAHAAARSTMSDEMKAVMDYYEVANEAIANGEDPAKYFVIQKTTSTDSVPALLGKIQWGQDTPYNNKCPVINSRRAVTGCVATAMAQVMRYYKYPAHGTGSCTYSGGNSGATTLVLDNITFDWNNMLESYLVNYTSTQASAVAELMLACGASLNMNYSSDGSGSSTSKVAGIMKNNFGYDKSIRYLDLTQSNENIADVEEDWGYAMQEQFDLGHPIIFSGYPALGKGGHCFIIDGYKPIDGVMYYHLNWGWEGSSDGWYLLTSLKPSDENYSGYGNVMVFNIFPPGWTDVENVESNPSGIDASAPIYNILGMPVSFENLQHGNIYIQKGRKILY